MQINFYDMVSKQGRNDGFPFVEDISTLILSADGSWKEYIDTKLVPGNRLREPAANFILMNYLVSKGIAYNNGIINLTSIPEGNKIQIG